LTTSTSLGGASVSLLDPDTRVWLNELAAQTRCIELNLQPDFQDRYMDHLAAGSDGWEE